MREASGIFISFLNTFILWNGSDSILPVRVISTVRTNFAIYESILFKDNYSRLSDLRVLNWLRLLYDNGN